MSETSVYPCTCEHAFQDRVYGIGKRLHNLTQAGAGKTIKVRCTVCSNTFEAKRQQLPRKEKQGEQEHG